MRYFTCAGLASIHFLLLLGFIHPLHAESIEVKTFANTQQERRYQALIDEIRCPVCQGQSIGGSNAGLAQDLREKVKQMIAQNASNDDIRQFMVARYGDFVVFKPPVNKNTYLLWFAPFIFLLLALLFFIRSIKVKKNYAPVVNTEKAKDLLK